MAGKYSAPPIRLNLLGKSSSRGESSFMQPSSLSAAVSVRFDDGTALDNLTPNSRSHLCALMASFASQVVKEAKAIEQSEHAGKGPPEVTAAHVEEAWWVSRRRVRRARNAKLLILLRAFETLGAAGVGVGASNYLAKWGIVTFMACLLLTCVAYVLETFAD